MACSCSTSGASAGTLLLAAPSASADSGSSRAASCIAAFWPRPTFSLMQTSSCHLSSPASLVLHIHVGFRV